MSSEDNIETMKAAVRKVHPDCRAAQWSPAAIEGGWYFITDGHGRSLSEERGSITEEEAWKELYTKLPEAPKPAAVDLKPRTPTESGERLLMQGIPLVSFGIDDPAAVDDGKVETQRKDSELLKDAEQIHALIVSKLDMSNACPVDWIWETLAVLEAKATPVGAPEERQQDLRSFFYRIEDDAYEAYMLGKAIYGGCTRWVGNQEGNPMNNDTKSPFERFGQVCDCGDLRSQHDDDKKCCACKCKKYVPMKCCPNGHKLDEDMCCSECNPAPVAGEKREGIQLPPLPKPMTRSKHWDGGIDWPLAGERAARLEREDQLMDALRGATEAEAKLAEALAKIAALEGK